MLVLPWVATAQTVRGAVVERAGGAPIPGVVMLLLDAGDRVAARALTNDQGQYRLVAAAAGTYRVRTLRIGYRPFVSLPFELAIDQELQQTLELSSVPVSLDTVRVSARGTCLMLTDTTGSIATAWEQARIAFMAAQLTAGVRTMKAAISRYQRTLDQWARRTLEDASWSDTVFTIKPWRSRSADSLRRFGYTQLNPDGSRTYHGPDLDVLLSSEFVQDHCFQLATSKGAEELIGVAFEPTRERSRVPGIRGTVWLHRTSSELRRLEFTYVNTGAKGIERAGGEMEFARMQNATWAIARWSIRAPILEQRRLPTLIPGDDPGVELRVRAWHVTGGQLTLVTLDRDTLWSRKP